MPPILFSYPYTVDGSEIRLRFVPVYAFIPLFTGFLYIPGGDRRISEPSTIINVWYIYKTKHTWIRHGLFGTSSPKSKWMGSKFLGLMGWSTENPRAYDQELRINPYDQGL